MARRPAPPRASTPNARLSVFALTNKLDELERQHAQTVVELACSRLHAEGLAANLVEAQGAADNAAVELDELRAARDDAEARLLEALKLRDEARDELQDMRRGRDELHAALQREQEASRAASIATDVIDGLRDRLDELTSWLRNVTAAAAALGHDHG